MIFDISEIHSGEIWDVKFDPTEGDEINKTRPSVVISSDGVNTLRNKIVVPITEWKEKFDNYEWFTKIEPDKGNMLTKKSGANSMQLRSVSVNRFKAKRGKVSAEILNEIRLSVAIIIEYI